MKMARILFVVVVVVLIGVAVYFGTRGQRGDLVVGGKNFTEQTILGEMAAQLIEDRLDLRVTRKFHLQTNLPIKMIQRGELSLYPDYTGTGYTDILDNTYQGEPPEEIYAHVKRVYPEEFDLEWLKPLGFENAYSLTMRAEQAEELGIEKISDLEEHTDALQAGFDPAFLDRQDGYPGLVEHYGFEFETPPKQLAIGLMYRACKEGEVDVIDAFTTDGRIDKFNLKILEDDKRFFPPYDAAFVVRQDALEKYPELRETLNLLAGRIDTKSMQRLNYAVDEEKRREEDVAREFLVDQGLLSAQGE